MSGRKVFVSSDMSVDERLLLVSEKNGMASLLWPWLLTALDDWGRCEAAPLRLKARVWPMNDTVSVALIGETLALLAEVGLIECYAVDGRAYLRIPPARWWKWQTHIHRDKREDDRSRIPAPAHEREREHEGERERPRESASVKSPARGRAESRGIARDSVPSPSPSPSPTHSHSHTTDSEHGDLAERTYAREADGKANGKAGEGLAADAALALVAPALSVASVATSSASSSATPSNVTRLPTIPSIPSNPKVARAPDPVWDACIAAMGMNGAAPSNRVERGKWAKGIQALKESLAADGSPPSEIVTRATRYRARFGTLVPLNPMALAGNWTTLATDAQEGQRHGNFGQRYSGNAGNARNAELAAAGRRGGRDTGRPAVGTPAYYAQAAAQAAAHAGGVAGQGGHAGNISPAPSIPAAIGEW